MYTATTFFFVGAWVGLLVADICLLGSPDRAVRAMLSNWRYTVAGIAILCTFAGRLFL